MAVSDLRERRRQVTREDLRRWRPRGIAGDDAGLEPAVEVAADEDALAAAGEMRAEDRPAGSRLDAGAGTGRERLGDGVGLRRGQASVLDVVGGDVTGGV